MRDPDFEIRDGGRSSRPGGGGGGGGGSTRAWGVFTIGNPKAWENSTGGMSGVESVE